MDSEELFAAALHTVQGALSDDDQAHFKRFQNHNEMIQDIRKSIHKYAGSNLKLIQCSKRIAAFSDAFAPFFDVIGVFVQVKPEWAAIFWGSIWFIFKLGTNLVNFLERVAEMFEEISYFLPQYKDWFAICKQTNSINDGSRLGQALAHVYHDLVEFIVSIYFIFSKQNQGRIKRIIINSELMLRPFQSRFAKLIERIQKHRIWFETEAKINEHGLVLGFYKDFKTFLKQSEDNVDPRNPLEDAAQVRRIKEWIQSSDYSTTYEHINQQIHPGTCQWFLQLDRYVTLKTAHFSDGHQWSTQRTDWGHQVLLVQAKPGFGKSFLSVRIINDLLEFSSKPGERNYQASVVFFHFSELDKRKPQTTSVALRAIAEQLIHHHRHNRATVDALRMVEMETGSGQRRSSDNDIRMLIDILLRQHPTFIVVDGIDECADAERLLEEVRALCTSHDCRFILLGRPNIQLPDRWSFYETPVRNILLTPELIDSDIQVYLDAQLDVLARKGLFGIATRSSTQLMERSRHDLLAHLGRKAEGLFLWARLLINLLSSVGLSPAERMSILEEPGYLHGLDALYGRTLEVLRRRSHREQQVAQKIFRWIAFAAIPLGLNAFRTVLALKPGSPITDLDYLPEYPAGIPVFTTALVEVSIAQDTLTFIHATFKDFLYSLGQQAPSLCMYPSYGNSTSGPARFLQRSLGSHSSLSNTSTTMNPPVASTLGRYHSDPLVDIVMSNDEEEMERDIQIQPMSIVEMETVEVDFGLTDSNAIHFCLATECISYLLFDIPPGPLLEIRRQDVSCRFQIDAASNTLVANVEEAEQIQSGPSRAKLDESYPFLRYSALCWYHHLIEAHSSADMHLTLWKSPPLWTTLLSQFLVNRFTVTTWVEAAYTYRLVPRLTRLLSFVQYMKPNSRPSSLQLREYWWIYQGLHQLSEALLYLAHTKRGELHINPSLIWQKEIVSAYDRNFWPLWKEDSELKATIAPATQSVRDGWMTDADLAASAG